MAKLTRKKSSKRVLLGVGYLAIKDCAGESRGGWTIPTAYGLVGKTDSNWKKLKGCSIAVGKRVKLYAEIISKPSRGSK